MNRLNRPTLPICVFCVPAPSQLDILGSITACVWRVDQCAFVLPFAASMAGREREIKVRLAPAPPGTLCMQVVGRLVPLLGRRCMCPNPRAYSLLHAFSASTDASATSVCSCVRFPCISGKTVQTSALAGAREHLLKYVAVPPGPAGAGG
jgi:hypothetical protein